MKRIAVFNRHFSRQAGGAESYSVAVAEGLTSDFDVHVYAQTLPAVNEVRHSKITYHKVAGPLQHPRWVNQLWFAFSTWWQTKNRFDTIISHENTWHGAIQVVHVRPIRYNLFFPNHAELTGWRKALRWIKVVTSPRLGFYVCLEAARMRAARGKKIVVVSQAMLDMTLKAYPHIEAADITIILPGVSAADFSVSKVQARVALGLPQDKTLLLFVGNDYARKGLPALLASLPSLDANIHLVCVGSAQQVPKFQLQAAELGIAERVHFLGSLGKIQPAYQACDILVHPTLEDSFAMVVLEALSYGLPVVVSAQKYCGISAFLQNSVNALLLEDPKDVTALTQTLQNLLSNSRLQSALSDAGRGFSADYGWEKAMDAFAAMINS